VGTLPTELPAVGENEVTAAGAGGSGGSAEGNPPLLGFGGSAESPPLLGLAGAPGSPDGSDAPAAVDAGVAPMADCLLGEFQAPELLTGVEQSLNPDLNLNLWSPSLSADGRTLFFAISADGIDELLASATRGDRGAVFSPAAALAGINSAGEDGTPLLSADGLSLYFYSTRPGGLGNRDVWRSTRADASAEFTAPTLLAGVNGPDVDHLPWVSPDELTLLWVTNRSGGVGQLDIWIARRNFRSDGFSSVAPLNGVNSTSNEGRAVLSNDELTMYFASERPGGLGSMDLWVATRNDRAGSFSQVTNLAGLNSSGLDVDPVLSADGRELMFSSSRDGRIRLWRSVRDCE
jgi:Tol biopolymer transport system component